MLAEYLEMDREASEETQPVKRPRTDHPLLQQAHAIHFHNRKQMEMQRWLFEAIAEIWRNTLKQDLEARSLESFIGGVLQGSGVAGMSKFSINEQGVDVVSRKKWVFQRWVHCQSRRSPNPTQLSVADSTHCRRRLYILHVPLGCAEELDCDKLGKECRRSWRGSLSMWKTSRISPTKTMSKGRQAAWHGLPELHQCFTFDDPVVPWDFPDQWDQLTGNALDLEKVKELKELQKFKER